MDWISVKRSKTCHFNFNCSNKIFKFNLNFLGPPYVHPIPELKAVVGKEFTFNCPASGYPIDRITWSKGKDSSHFFRSRRSPLSKLKQTCWGFYGSQSNQNHDFASQRMEYKWIQSDSSIADQAPANSILIYERYCPPRTSRTLDNLNLVAVAVVVEKLSYTLKGWVLKSFCKSGLVT